MSLRNQSRRVRTSWDHLATWYDGWVGDGGSEHHRKVATPMLLELLELRRRERLLDLGCGQGVLAAATRNSGVFYTGLDVSPRMIAKARRMHGRYACFIQGDACRLQEQPEIAPASFDAVAFLLSIQNMDPLERALESAAWALKRGGRAVILMTHPCFRVPRQSGWGWDEDRRLSYRRVDRYLGTLAVPLKPLRSKAPVISFHRPLEDYFAALNRCGFVVDDLREGTVAGATAARDAMNPEIPLFMGLRARLTGRPN